MCEYHLQIKEDNDFLGKNGSLIPSLGNKTKYKLQYHNLQLYLELKLLFKNNS